MRSESGGPGREVFIISRAKSGGVKRFSNITGRVRTFSNVTGRIGSGQVESGRVGSGGFQNLANQMGSGQDICHFFRGSGQLLTRLYLTR